MSEQQDQEANALPTMTPLVEAASRMRAAQRAYLRRRADLPRAEAQRLLEASQRAEDAALELACAAEGEFASLVRRAVTEQRRCWRREGGDYHLAMRLERELDLALEEYKQPSLFGCSER